jgi:mono/diheme cytochrome c family protein
MRDHPTIAARVVASILFSAGSAAAQAAPAKAGPDTPALAPDVIEAGRAIFHGQGTCFACHGANLQGGPLAPSLRGPKWRHADGTFPSILHVVMNGSAGTLMVSHPGDIDDTQATRVATYVFAVSQGKAKP